MKNMIGHDINTDITYREFIRQLIINAKSLDDRFEPERFGMQWQWQHVDSTAHKTDNRQPTMKKETPAKKADGPSTGWHDYMDVNNAPKMTI